MNLHNMLKARAAEGNPVRVGLIGAGKFGAMFLAQARTTTGMHIGGFRVVCAGKGTRYHPDFHDSIPETVWENFGWTPGFAEHGGMNPKMFNSFIDGTKSGIEMTASCNATSLTPQPDGLGFPPSPRMELTEVCKPQEFGGTLTHSGTTEVVSSLDRDLQAVPNHLQMGTYVVIEADTDYVKHCFEEYYMLPDSSFQFAALYRPIHLIGLELGISVASVVLRNDPTGPPTGFRSDVAATAKRNLRAGEILDGEGGFTVWGKQTPTEVSLREGYLPLGLSGNVKLLRDVPQGERLRWQDVEMDLTSPAVRIRREMEAAFGPQS